ncbi:unnamed protein product [Ilex paraguariensis]|uniref:Cytochrome b5 heme-binding domain-containing protein n=1 Tax=Ilex paraguariensis TaxID=185542 RepID=A0ABC8QQQ7_9AQUA
MEFHTTTAQTIRRHRPIKTLYVAIRGRVFYVTAGRSFYEPGKDYIVFAGKDASRALAKMSKNEEDVCANLNGLSNKEISVLNDLEKKFEAKYPIVGNQLQEYEQKIYGPIENSNPSLPIFSSAGMPSFSFGFSKPNDTVLVPAFNGPGATFIFARPILDIPPQRVHFWSWPGSELL